MDNQTKPESSGGMMISTSELRRRAVPKKVLVKSLLSRTPNVPPNEIASEAQNRSAVKVEPSDKIVLQVQNQSEMNVESKSRRYKNHAKRTPRHNSTHKAPHVPLDEIDLGVQNRSEVKVERKLARYKNRAERSDGDGGGEIDLKDEIDLEARNQFEVKVELPEKIALQVQNQSKVKVEPKSRRYNHSAERSDGWGGSVVVYGRGYSGGGGRNGGRGRIGGGGRIGGNRFYGGSVSYDDCSWLDVMCGCSLSSLDTGRGGGVSYGGDSEIDLKDEIDLEDRNQSDVKVELPEKIALQSLPPIHILDHEDVLEAQNQSKVKSKPQENIALQVENQCLQVENQCEVKVESKFWLCVQDQIKKKTTERALLITSVLLEAMSAVFDQVGHALTSMVIAFLALFFSSLDLICKARKEGVNWSQPFGGLLEYYGLAAAVWQCFNSTMGYIYTRKNQQNPIKMCLLPFMFASCVLIFSLIKRRT